MDQKVSAKAKNIFRAAENFKCAPFNEVSDDLNNKALVTAMLLCNKKNDMNIKKSNSKTSLAHAG